MIYQISQQVHKKKNASYPFTLPLQRSRKRKKATGLVNLDALYLSECEIENLFNFTLPILCFEQNDGSQVVYTFLPNFCILPFSVQLCKQFHRFLAEHLPALDTDSIRSYAAAFLTRNTQQGCALPDRGAAQNTANRRNQNGCSGPFPAAGLLMNGQQGR